MHSCGDNEQYSKSQVQRKKYKTRAKQTRTSMFFCGKSILLGFHVAI